jgi:hypothetical protein
MCSIRRRSPSSATSILRRRRLTAAVVVDFLFLQLEVQVQPLRLGVIEHDLPLVELGQVAFHARRIIPLHLPHGASRRARRTGYKPVLRLERTGYLSYV